MNSAHVHILINHLPVFGSFLGIVVLAYGLIRKSNVTINAAYLVLIIAAVGGVIAYYTGGPAAGIVKEIPGVAKNAIHEHAQAAYFALISMSIVAVFSIIGAILIMKNSPRVRTIAWITLFISLWAFSVVARTAYLGGMIRHTEIADKE